MFTRFEHFAATSLMGTEGAPPRKDGSLAFDRDWEQIAFGVAIALSKQGYYEWEDFRQSLIEAIAQWEATHDLNDQSWDYYQCWLAALEKVAFASQVIDEAELQERVAQILNCKDAP